MLTALTVRDVVLIEALDIAFGDGLGVLTGETGAGKSILLDSLGLALGARADTGLVRSGQAQASVVATFEVPPEHNANALLADQGLEAEPGEPLVVRRLVRADGGSRAFVNDQPVSAGFLREIGGTLVEIHGQQDDRGLLNPRGHRALLDTFAGVDLREVGGAWRAMEAADAAVRAARDESEAAERDREWLDHAVEELGALAAEPGEEEKLADERARMQAGARITDDLQTLTALVSAAEGGLSQLRQAARRLDRAAEAHPLLGEALAALDRALIEGTVAEEKIDAAAEALAYSPERLDEVEARLFDIRAMARKHRVPADGLAALLNELSARREAISASGDRIAALTEAANEARAVYDEAAAALSAQRRAAATRLDATVAAELAPLKLDAARLRTAMEPGEPGPAGIDRVAFEVSTNPGAPFGPLTKIASGGELSRFILALKVALAEAGGARTLVFDEIDRGVGGAVASAIGERLHRLAEASQVLVVTHSPQVAARGAHHLLIAKTSDGLVTRTGVTALDAARRREEIARMLSGAEITDEARAQARRLLETV